MKPPLLTLWLLPLAVLANQLWAAAPPPYPSSRVIAAMEWTSTNRILRAAPDGDNWPVNWADDDALYTTWGDGTGFDAIFGGNNSRSQSGPRIVGTPASPADSESMMRPNLGGRGQQRFSPNSGTLIPASMGISRPSG